MDFGKLDDISKVDFTLPDDDYRTEKLFLDSAKSFKGKPEIYIGCAKWGRKDWIGKIYPKGTKEKDFLKIYAQNFNSIELNAVHYNIPSEKSLLSWKDAVGEDFKFFPKFYQGISHWKRLKEAEEVTETYLAAMQKLDGTLGDFFLQMHPTFTPKSFDVLEKYVKWLPKDAHVHLELRHPEWFANPSVKDELYHLLSENNVGFLITDAAGRRDVVHTMLTTPVAFIRFVGNGLHPTDYTRIDEWIIRMKKWLDGGLQKLYFFMHQHDELHSPVLVKYLIDKMNKECALNLQSPNIIEE
ncbi:MAG: DUF72 domain-containing protein [Bacteroidetes bacterium]|nr:DUF72 domain-containing protein [Bacteroidota bacterium]